MQHELSGFGKGLIAPDLVAAARIMRGTNLGSTNGLPQTGKSIELRVADLVHIAEGTSARWGYFDPKKLLQKLQGFRRVLRRF